jgi:hypothetical protein
MTGHVTDTAPHPAASTGSFATRRCARRSAIGTACAARAACRRGWTSTPVCCARICRTPPSSRWRARAACASGWAARGSTRFWGWMCGACRSGRCSTCRNGPGSRTGWRRRWQRAASDPRRGLSRAALRPAGGEALRAQIAILPMTDVDLAPTRALYVMGAVERRVAQGRRAASLVRARKSGSCLCARASRCCRMRRLSRPRAPSARPAWDETKLRGARARWPARGSG